MGGRRHVCVQNLTRGRTLAERAVVASTYLMRLVGLLGWRSLPAGDGLLLIPCKIIHTCFMRFPIDVVFLDKEFRILELAENMRPFKVSPFLPAAYCVLELPTGTIRETATEKGDVVCIE